ncbi:MAG: hypothetical protein CEN90_682 [Parcubacteria group bacterium Licking1014_17]|nr:MAG: hypothetical protein CEN90_682 [Parcubacteria group bacterium Licking1014_17]
MCCLSSFMGPRSCTSCDEGIPIIRTMAVAPEIDDLCMKCREEYEKRQKRRIKKLNFCKKGANSHPTQDSK